MVLENNHVEFLTTSSDLMVMRTQDMDIITVRFCGGSILFAAAPSKKPCLEAETTVVHPTTPKEVTVKMTTAAAAAKKTPTTKNTTTKSPKKRRREETFVDEEDYGELTQECSGLLH